MLYYETYGEGKAILYLHGWGASGAVFKPVVERLPNYLNITVDFDGFGSSPMPPEEGFTVYDYAERIVELLRGINAPKVTVVAHSFGCRVSLVLASKYSEFIDGMLLFAPAGLRRFSLKRWCKIRLYKLKKRLRVSCANLSGSADYQATADGLKRTFVKVVNQDLSREARKARCKTLIVAAKQDVAVPYRDALRLSKLVANSDFVSVEGDHFALFYSPSAFAQIIRLFVEEQCSSQR